MKDVFFMSSKAYPNSEENYGDCILIDNGSELVIYDCGCEEHAQRAIDYMKEHHYTKAKLVLSHNDKDHFDGIPYLTEQGVISAVYALLLLKYKDELLNIIDDGRRKRTALGEQIKELYDNIASLSGANLKDIFEDTSVASGVTIVGPSKDYALEAVAKQLANNEDGHVDKETIGNAVSTQLSVDFGQGKKLLLTGDSSFAAIEANIKNHNAIQLPHHGKLSQAEDIFEAKDNRTIYYVSDNTGNSNGGSDDLRKEHPKGYVIYNTLDGDQHFRVSSLNATNRVGTYF
jgi:beta-lactamase superfamily II metal-dependent hydrolase